METKLQYNSKEYQLKRYPETNDNSLRAWSSVELLIADYYSENLNNNKKIHLYNDRFGVWNCLLNNKKLSTITTYASQEKAIVKNLELNKLSSSISFNTTLDNLLNVDIALIKIPKSVALFELFLQQIQKASNNNTVVVCGFMTKYFSASYLKIASSYFDEITQTKAWKKARLLILKNPKKDIIHKELLNKVTWKNNILHQYYGVFSSDKIDIGTQFLLENLKVKETELNVLDVASGNGIIAYEVCNQNSKTKVTLVDDFNLAIESSKLNLKDKQADFVCSNNLEELSNQKYDLVVSNPPFHFEHENNIEVSLSLFSEIKKILKVGGRFVLVANRHLNYKTHLDKIFREVLEVNQNIKFVIYECKL